MARTLLTSTSCAALAVGMSLVGLLLPPGALPRSGENAKDYLARGLVAAEELYFQALLLVPGSLQATVSTSSAVGEEPKPGDREEKEARREQDKLKQAAAKDEEEISAQQEVSARRYAEAKREALIKEKDSPLLVGVDQQPDDVRASMDAVDPTGPEMRCGQRLLPESSITTRGVELRAAATFQGKYGGEYGWKYVITFVNHGSDTVQMLTRHWVFVNSEGKLESEVKGPGARGVTPVLPPKGEWSYESGTSLSTPYGSMHGSFQFEILKGPSAENGLRSFSARVGRLLLSSRKKENERGRKVPCVAEVDGQPLPLTSVLSTERVILGGRAEAVGRRDRGENRVYTFQYDVQFNNAREEPIEIVGHTWEVVDSSGQRLTVAEGAGVGGLLRKRSRTLPAGDAFRVQGELESPTKEANAQGTFKVILSGSGPGETLREIEVRTDWMGLAGDPSQTHVPNFVADPRFSMNR